MKSPFFGSFSLTEMPAHVRASSAKLDFFPLADTGDLCHLGFQLLITFPKLGDLPEIVLDSAIEIFLLRLLQSGACLPVPLAPAGHRAPFARRRLVQQTQVL